MSPDTVFQEESEVNMSCELSSSLRGDLLVWRSEREFPAVNLVYVMLVSLARCIWPRLWTQTWAAGRGARIW
ncbi:hypothetical protein RRG08_014975 [Elysia crispata]|uniref:Uncharacterized protein n=1 Tax=Elysia crispata TaxID=231223 RepID=A0AAE1DN36_9GAST|nr:hypothetical protein RRG08_014975 [Elysia crispata]